MKVAAVVWNGNIHADKVIDYMQSTLIKAYETEHKIIVFPGLLHVVYKQKNEYLLNNIVQFSKTVPNLLICPGSFYEQSNGKTYHSSCLIQDGEILLKQRQIYLSKWERNDGLSRGTDIRFIEYHSFKIAIIISTDIFYPQVARYAALQGVNLVLSPVAIVGEGHFSLQLSGLWQNVQQNTIFAVESGLKRNNKEYSYYSESNIYAPIELTDEENGFLARERHKTPFISASLQLHKLNNRDTFNPLRQLNPNAYGNLF